MGDLFDEFMRELERRRAEAEGRAPRTKPGDARDPGDPDAPAGADEPATSDAGAADDARAGTPGGVDPDA
ncbi:MAG TPA: hypothetical protein VFY23_04560, partial [Candidatus Limnocylindrales bacterium]|nr:hypothetical protein [Candidatus Limnocylindrales bacterium]